MLTEEQFVSVPGGELYVKHWKPSEIASEVPLVLLHDSLGCVEAWRDFPARLAERVRREVIAYDRLGFGRSTERAELPSVRFIDEEAELYFPALHRALGLETFALFGYSVGGEMSVAIAGQMANKCEKLVVMSAQAGLEEHTLKGVETAKARFADPAQLARLARWHGPKAEWTLRAWQEVWLSPDFNWTLAPSLPHVTCPVLVMHGDQDEYGTLEVPATIHRLVQGPCEVHIFKNCGHAPHRERLEEVLTLTSNFLSR